MSDDESSDSKGAGQALGAASTPEVFSQQIASELEKTQDQIEDLAGSSSGDLGASLTVAREKVAQLVPVPPFIWRIVNYSIGRPSKINKLSDGSLFGLKKLVGNIGKDKVIGRGSSLLTTRAVIEDVSSDVIAATALIHALARRLQTKDFQAVWGPILDDALLRAQIGYFVGTMREDFGPGRGMLAGFAGRIGLAVLIAMGTSDQAQAAITQLASGRKIEEVALELYRSEPLHVAAMILAAAGCGADAVFGVATFGFSASVHQNLDRPTKQWLAALIITERIRFGEEASLDEATWARMGYEDASERGELAEIVTTLKRRGHGWNWML
jgi:hypothetical protein